MHAIVAIVIAMSGLTGQSCAGIDNAANKAVWQQPSGRVVITSYKDMDRIIYMRAPGRHNNAAWKALHAAERGLQRGKAGPKVRFACR